MATNNPQDLYPIATQDGQQIIYQVARPRIVTQLSLAVGGDLIYPISKQDSIFEVYARVLTLCTFDSIVSTVSKVPGLVIAPEERATFIVPAGTQELIFRALDIDGVAFVHEFDTYHGLTTKNAFAVR